MISCDDLLAFVDGELDAADAGRFRGHLRSCHICQLALPETSALVAQLSSLPRKTLSRRR